jgi:GntR family histidine utilization transcriptional repressor
MTAIDTNSWQGVRAEVMRRIADGDWQPGELIPGEVDLADEFGCARATVNRALQDLADAGLIERKRKAGTRVALNPVRKVTVEVPVIRKDVEARGSRYSFALLGSRIMTPSPAITAQYGLPDASLLGLWTLHHADHQPFALEERWVNLDVVPAIAKADLDAVSANEWLVQHMPLVAGRVLVLRSQCHPARGPAAGVRGRVRRCSSSTAPPGQVTRRSLPCGWPMRRATSWRRWCRALCRSRKFGLAPLTAPRGRPVRPARSRACLASGSDQPRINHLAPHPS